MGDRWGAAVSLRVVRATTNPPLHERHATPPVIDREASEEGLFLRTLRRASRRRGVGAILSDFLLDEASSRLARTMSVWSCR